MIPSVLPPGRPGRRLFGPLELAILLLGATVLGQRAWTSARAERLARQLEPLVQSSAQVELRISQAHLWFEEWMSGDPSIDLERQVSQPLEDAIALSRALLDGGDTFIGHIAAQDDARLRAEAGRLTRALERWRELTHRRREDPVAAQPGSALDQDYDAQYELVLQITGACGRLVRGEADRVRAAARRGEYLDIALAAALFLALLAMAARTRHSLERRNHELEERVAERTARLATSEAHTRAILDTLLDGVVTIDARGTVLSYSPAAERIFGHRAGEVVGRNVNLLIPEPERGRHDGHLARYLATGEAHIVGRTREVMAQHRDGSLLPIDLSVSEIGGPDGSTFVGTVREIAERKRTARALGEALEMQRAILDGTDYSIISTDPEGVIRTFNAAAERMLGYRAEEVVGRVTPALVHDPEEVAARAEALSEELGETVAPGFEAFVARARRGDADENEWTYVARDGRRIPVLLSVTSLRDAGGEITGFLGLASDITERRRAAQATVAAMELAEAANLAKSQFLAAMSHELRTPLNSVIGFANILLKNKRGSLSPQELAYLGRILDNGRHLLHLINDILDLSKIEAGKMKLDLEPVELRPLVVETLAELEAQVRDRPVALVADVPDGVAHVFADRVRLKQVLINLVGNAIKFTERGRVVVSVRSDAAGVPISLDVQDTGIGIAPDRLERIFDAFEQAESGTRRRRGGTGLGLTLARAMVEQMRFAVEAESRPGVGSCFRVLFRPARPASAPTLAGTAPGRGAALAVDDDPESRLLLAQALGDLGFEVETACSVEEALERARARQFDLITTDLVMPGRSGWDLLRELKADPELSAIPVMVVSLVSSEERAAVLGTVERIDKPVERDDLERAIERCCPRAGSRVLIVDDDPDAREVAAQILADLGFAVTAAASGAEGLARLRERTFDLVLLDLAMPGMDGTQVLAAIRADPGLAALPVIVLTASESAAVDPEALRASASAILRKGPDLERDLAAAVKRALG